MLHPELHDLGSTGFGPVGDMGKSVLQHIGTTVPSVIRNLGPGRNGGMGRMA